MPTQEQYLDWVGMQSGECEMNTDGFYAGLDRELAALDLDEIQARELQAMFYETLNRVLFHLLNMRISDPKALDMFAVKFLNPEMSHSDISEFLNMAGKSGWKNRSQSCEKWRSLVSRFPNLEHVLFFDPRGGYRQRPSLNQRLLDEYRELKERNTGKPMENREMLYGEGGWYHRMAVKYQVMGADGKPSGGAVQSRIDRASSK